MKKKYNVVRFVDNKFELVVRTDKDTIVYEKIFCCKWYS